MNEDIKVLLLFDKNDQKKVYTSVYNYKVLPLKLNVGDSNRLHDINYFWQQSERSISINRQTEKEMIKTAEFSYLLPWKTIITNTGCIKKIRLAFYLIAQATKKQNTC